MYRGQELSFPCRLLMQGYTYAIEVDVEGQFIRFEPDEERNYRAVLTTEQVQKGIKIDIELLKAIAKVIESVIV